MQPEKRNDHSSKYVSPVWFVSGLITFKLNTKIVVHAATSFVIYHQKTWQLTKQT